MNIYTCRAGTLGNLHCVYKNPEVDSSTGEVCFSCGIKGSDKYTLYPEHDVISGEVVHNNLSSDPIPVGVDVIWESISSHEHGLTCNFDRPLRIYETIHPEYHIQNSVRPLTSGKIPLDQICEIFGEDEPTLVSQSWSDVNIFKLPKVDYCSRAIYGSFSKMENKIIAKCMRDYTNSIKDWVNYTTFKLETKSKKIFVCEMNDEELYDFFSDNFANDSLVNNLIEIVNGIKQGTFVNLADVIMSYGITEEKTKRFLGKISTRTKANLYDSSINLINYLYLMRYMFNKHSQKDENGKIFVTLEGKMIIGNILNYLLNNPSIQIDPESNIGFFEPQNRFWLLVPMIRLGLKEDIFDKDKLPKWLSKQIMFIKRNVKQFKINGTVYDYSDDLPDELKSEIADACYNGYIQKETSIIDLEKGYPAMMRIKDIINFEVQTDSDLKKFRKFVNILKSGIKWCIPEIKECWNAFQNALNHGDPKIFWIWINDQIDLTYDEANKHVDGNLSQSRQFAINLFNSKISNTSFDVRPPEFLNRWYVTSGKANIGGTYEDGGKSNDIAYNQFWKALKISGGIGKERKRFSRMKGLLQKAKLHDSFLVDISDFNIGLDEEDYEELSIIDATRDDVTIYEE